MTLLNVEQPRLAAASERLMASEQLMRDRRKEARTVTYDLRPLVLDLRVGPPDPAALPPEIGGIDAGPIAAAGLWMRLRHSQNLGSGRADEVVAALADEMGMAAVAAPGTEEGVEGNATGDGPLATPERPASQPPLEVLRPVRERLWLAEELEQVSAT
jgi:hypothetical protein